MGGMGRGMPNMNMGMGMNSNGQNKQPNFLQFIYQSLTQSQQNDGPFTGWRGALSIQERAAQIKILFDSLRMLGSTVDTKRSLDIALAFERKQFMQSSTQDAYKHSIHEKLASIRDQRQQQVTTAANGMPNASGPPNGMMNGFPQMGGANQNMNFPQQQGMQPSSMLPQMQQQPSMNPTQPLNQQINPAHAANNAIRANPPPELTKEDNTWINTRAAEMAKSTPREQMSQIVESMDPRVRQSLTEKKIDPIIYHFRMKATKEFRMQQAQRGGQPQAMMGMTMPRTQTPNQNPGVPPSQPNATPFMNNIDQFRGQQEEGMRSQQEGQLVVPASNPAQTQTQMPTADMIRRHQQNLAQQFKTQNPNASDQDVRNFVSQKMNQMQIGMQRARSQAAQQAGQGQTVMQQQNRMNMLNQPMNQNSTHNSPMQNVPRPQSRPHPAQMIAQGHPAQAQQGMTVQAIQQNMQKFPVHLQELLAQRPQSDWQAIVAHWRQRPSRPPQAFTQQQQQQQQLNQAAAMQRSASQQAQNMPVSQNLQQAQTGQFPGPSPMQASLSMGAEQHNQMPAMNATQMRQQGMNPNAQMIRMQQQQQQQHQHQQQQQQQQRMAQQNAMGAQKSNQTQILFRETDNMNAHEQFRQKFVQIYAQAHQNIPNLQTWQDFKEFTSAQAQPRVSLNTIQQQQFIFAQKRRQAISGSTMPQMSQPNQPALQAPMMAQQGSGIGPQPNQPQITLQDIQAARIANPLWDNLTDDQVRELVATQQFRPQRPQLTAVQGQSQGINAVQGQNNTRPVTQQRPGSQAVQQNRPQPQNQVQPPTENRSLKRPNQDDAPEGNLAQPPNNNRPPLTQITKEQFDQMTPADKEKFLTQRRQLEVAHKVQQLSKEIYTQMRPTPRITGMDQNSRQKIVNMLTDDTTKKMLSRFDSFLIAFSQNESDQNYLRVLIQHRWRLMQQYTEDSWRSKTYQPAEHFTLNADNLENILKNVTMKFQQTAKNSASSRGAQPDQLTQENLIRKNQETAQLQKSKVAKPKDGPPPAPTGEKPPFQFPSDRGQGAPKYATPGFRAEDLKLPPKKRIRNDASASPATPAQTQQPRPLLKCPSQGCNAQGFTTQAELDLHRNQVHKPEMEPVRDPVGFLNNSMQQAFDLDGNLDPKKASAAAGSTEESLSQGGKTDSKGATPAAMARGSSLQGRKDIPPASQQGSQQANGIQQPLKSTQDSWADCKFTFEDLVNTFGPTESGDIIPMAVDNQALLDRTYDAYTRTDEYKRIFGDSDNLTSSEGSSNKSKSPDQGSEPSLPTNDQVQGRKGAEQDPYDVDFNMGGDQLPILEGNFDDLFVGDGSGDDWEKLDAEGSMSDWEKIDSVDDDQQQQKSGRDEFDLDSWISEPAAAGGEDNVQIEKAFRVLHEPTDWDELYSSGDPSLYAGGTLAWNAIGKQGEEMRRKKGWPIEGATGQASKAKRQK
ncbi:hypothetical protein OHC33_007145 [Knufia fluminis]|uniref:Mediator complex subunit 15 KIX domain-containing protein n=1 Tax=Knufia fluminis TaxID=191047 RepID=A0AAN8ETK9_9EURO|nr:hypothetical protein OHC33_007145 [Knufia fluminis]